MLSDNTTAVCAINNMASCKSFLCDQEVRRIWSWVIDRDIFITAAHIPGILNVKADPESRKSELKTAQLPQSFAYQPDPKAEVINAFCVSWHNLSFYCFPQFSCIGKVLQKVISYNATGTLIVPNWPSQFCFIVLQYLLLTEASIIPPNADDLYLPK